VAVWGLSAPRLRSRCHPHAASIPRLASAGGDTGAEGAWFRRAGGEDFPRGTAHYLGDTEWLRAAVGIRGAGSCTSLATRVAAHRRRPRTHEAEGTGPGAGLGTGWRRRQDRTVPGRFLPILALLPGLRPVAFERAKDADHDVVLPGGSSAAAKLGARAALSRYCRLWNSWAAVYMVRDRNETRRTPECARSGRDVACCGGSGLAMPPLLLDLHLDLE
jgi:hypothetical protein